MIVDTCFTSLAAIGGNLFSRHTNNMNNVKKDKNDPLSMIITLGTNVNVGETVFNGLTTNYLGERAHILKH